MDIILRNESDEPIYQQITEQIKAQIMDGTLTAGDALPSMRTLAAQLRISVITTKRAYEELERSGYIENYTGKGCFVKKQNTDFLREETIRQTEEMLAQVCKKARLCGLSADDLKEMVDIMYTEGNDND
ncbi:MAG: GntR family transcriptional regulator [Ruminococcus sp.]|uniref:GntR family transcriptional regulator n=1 Tax=Ruminococcus albus TaxID=1264 RepID=A0A1I1K0W9_RUMAL|nr:MULTISPECIES: GntR family transcriptional regulator [Ruminococcus]MBO4865415.1 GntR family transcriptional regulator [Ruminococcus sp.]SEL11281.1 transcriptional regulator, GntR family [Ruminococcus albus]SFC54396.1 GntR family transcriptional regulator [Ruminococcus albus]